jgi:hypothetical protein
MTYVYIYVHTLTSFSNLNRSNSGSYFLMFSMACDAFLLIGNLSASDIDTLRIELCEYPMVSLTSVFAFLRFPNAWITQVS